MDSKHSNACLILGRLAPVSFSHKMMSLCSGNSPTIFLDESEDGMSQSQFLRLLLRVIQAVKRMEKMSGTDSKDQLKLLLIEDGGLSSIQSGEN